MESNKKIMVSSLRQFPELYILKEECCGCTACYSICPNSAISMHADDEGFLYPFLLREKCIKCYRCLEVCPIKHSVN